MRNLLALIGLLVVVVGGAGWYLGWYKVNLARNPEGNLQIQTDVDTNKLSTDSSAFFQKMGQMASSHAQQASQNNNATQPIGAPGNTTGPVTIPPDTNPQPPQNGGGGFVPNIPIPPAPPAPGMQ